MPPLHPVPPLLVPAPPAAPGSAPRLLAVLPSPRQPVDLDSRRRTTSAALRTAAAAPVRHVPTAFLDALHGSWGTAQELFGVPATVHDLAVAR